MQLLNRINLVRNNTHGQVTFFIDYRKDGNAQLQLERELQRIIDEEIASRHRQRKSPPHPDRDHS